MISCMKMMHKRYKSFFPNLLLRSGAGTAGSCVGGTGTGVIVFLRAMRHQYLIQLARLWVSGGLIATSPSARRWKRAIADWPASPRITFITVRGKEIVRFGFNGLTARSVQSLDTASR